MIVGMVFLQLNTISEVELHEKKSPGDSDGTTFT